MRTRINALLRPAGLLRNEDGSVIVAAILILVFLTIIGIASTNVSNTEVQIAGHEVAYQQNFYRAEGATMEAVELMEGIVDPLFAPPAWLEITVGAVTDADVQDAAFWGGSGSVNPEPSALADSQFVAASEGIVAGASLGMGGSTVYGFTIYGRCAPPRRGATVIQIGYLKAF